MSSYITLLGAENVQHAANSIQQSAESMRQSVLNFTCALERNQYFLDNWLARFEKIVEKTKIQEHE